MSAQSLGLGVAGDDGGLELVGTGLAWPGGLRDELGGLGDRLVVPAGSVLVLQQHEVAVRTESGVGAGAVEPDQGEQAGHLGLGRHQPVEQRGEPLGVVDEVA